MIRLLAALLFAASLHAQANFDLEKGALDGPLEGWFAPRGITDFKVTWSDHDCHQGTGCADITPTVPAPKLFGNIMQSINATPYLGKRIRFRAAVKTTGSAHAQLWVRIDLNPGGMGFFDNMGDRPIRTQGEWRHFEIDGFVNPDAKNIALGVMAVNGAIRVDDASLTVTGDLPKLTTDAPRPLTPQGLRNLQAFTTLYGLIRHFHPSYEAERADWNLIAIEGARKVEGADDLAKTLAEIFQPVAPTLRIFSSDPPAIERPAADLALVRIQHKGFGQGRVGNTYVTKTVPAASFETHTATLPGGLKAIFPLTLPKTYAPTANPLPPSFYTANDRSTRLASVIIAWNIFQHFYPYFDVVQTDWNAQLPIALHRAAVDPTPLAFQSTLRRMVASLKDGHGNVYGNFGKATALTPVLAAWVENKYIVTVGNADVKPGDEIVAINGKSPAALIAEAEQEISSATPQYARGSAAARLLSGEQGSAFALTVRPFNGTETKEVSVICNVYQRPALWDNRPATSTAELQPGIWYVDLTRSNDQEFEALLPKLAKATGIVFDMRGYPKVSPAWFSHVSKTNLKSAQWHVPLIDRPGHMEFTRGGEWNLQPKAPYLEAQKVFLTNGGAISYAESTMGIVEAYKIGEIIGEATAGTNGNINPFTLPGGYNVVWTGMKVIKHDGTRHHGVGIRPTIPLQPTQAGIAAGRDELLERAIAVIRAGK